MKYSLVIPVIFFAISSCKKTDKPVPQNTATDSSLVSMTYTRPMDHSRSIESYSYTENRGIAGILIHAYDTLGTTYYADSTLFTFNITNSPNPPASCDITWFKDGNSPTGATEHHLLFYDNQNRIIEDSITTSTGDGLSTQYFIYDRGLITVQWSYPDQSSPTGYSFSQTDTLSITDGNIGGTIEYSNQFGFDDQENYTIVQQNFEESNDYSYSVYNNPLFQTSLSNSLGALLRFNNVGDFISQKLAGSWRNTFDLSTPATTLDYTWHTDDAGRVTQGSGVNRSSGSVADTYTFNYK